MVKKNRRGRDVVEIEWQIDDGYVGQSRPQTVEIPLDELAAEVDPDDDETSSENILRMIEDWIREDFSQRVGWEVISGIDEAIEAAKAARASEEETA